jgi:hypothetical protein
VLPADSLCFDELVNHVLSIGDPDLEIVDNLIGTIGTGARTEADTSCGVIRITEGGTLHRFAVDRAGESTVIEGKFNGVPRVVVATLRRAFNPDAHLSKATAPVCSLRLSQIGISIPSRASTVLGNRSRHNFSIRSRNSSSCSGS